MVSVICASSGRSGVAVASAICVGTVEPGVTVPGIGAEVSSTMTGTVAASGVCAMVGIPVGVLPGGIVGVGRSVGSGVAAAANGFGKFCSDVNPTEMRANTVTAIAMNATASGIRVPPIRCPSVGGFCEMLRGGVGGGASCSNSGAT